MNQDERRNEATKESPISYTPGAQEDKETAAARANRTNQKDTTDLTPEDAELRKPKRRREEP